MTGTPLGRDCAHWLSKTIIPTQKGLTESLRSRPRISGPGRERWPGHAHFLLSRSVSIPRGECLLGVPAENWLTEQPLPPYDFAPVGRRVAFSDKKGELRPASLGQIEPVDSLGGGESTGFAKSVVILGHRARNRHP